MSEADTPWARLASRATRVALTRKDVTYGSLVEALADDGVSGGERAIVSKISRGTLKLSLFLHILSVTKVQPPERWADAMREPGSWDVRASAVLNAELLRQPSVLIDDLAARLTRLGTTTSRSLLEAQTRAGSVQLSLFIQMLHILNSDSMERFIDLNDMVEAARHYAEVDNT
jgi:hypothetical protein